MRNYIKSFLIYSVALAFLSCSTDAPEPEVSFNVDNANPQVGEAITFNISGGADTYVFYTGDTSHDFANSHLVLTEGIDVDKEFVVLATDSLPKIKDFLQPYIDSHNENAGENDQLDLDVIITNIATQVGLEYTNKLTAAYIIWEYMTQLQGQVTKDIVDMFYEDKSTLLAPEGGFSTGFAINRYEKTFEYTYTTPGMYVVTLIASNLSNKQYSGSGYQDDRTSSGDEYDINRTIRELIITVQP
ncbi:hypothetical protein SAMN06265371_1054 [Lutibacter agarilyticus]|uniref:DUF5017 domain-containing protein n=2 Tax=Lutibacter agarilyticus TaxID=1109740 RepID=A0A238X6I1_9FLAO|nr:hypothetical protein SAMN06265371_1054 [Lutibacter agarilyticus]